MGEAGPGNLHYEYDRYLTAGMRYGRVTRFVFRCPVIVMHSNKIQQCVEALCQNGCRAVRATIDVLESGQEVPQMSHLNAEERSAVLNELKSIMSVYDGECGI